MSQIPPPAPTWVLSAEDEPLVWIDCEMTGLDPKRDRLLEIACIVTDGQLQPVDEGVSYVIRTEPHILEGMDEWCTRTHSQTGLYAACLDEACSHPHLDVRTAILAYVLDRVPTARKACLAGSSVHADKMFLVNEMPELMAHLHYRIVDVSTIKELVRRWYGVSYQRPDTGILHRYVSRCLSQSTRRYSRIHSRYDIHTH